MVESEKGESSSLKNKSGSEETTSAGLEWLKKPLRRGSGWRERDRRSGRREREISQEEREK